MLGTNGRVARKHALINYLVTLLKEQELAVALTQFPRLEVKTVRATLMMLNCAIRISLVVCFSVIY